MMRSEWGWLLGVAVVAAVIAATGTSWHYASRYSGEGPLQWCMVSKAAVFSGLQFNEEHVEWAIRRVKASDTCVADARRVVGKYARSDVSHGEVVTPAHLSEFAPAKVPGNGAAVPVEVKTQHTKSLRPGVRLAFVQEKDQEKDKAIVMIPPAKETPARKPAKGKAAKDAAPRDAKPEPRGFELISIALSAKDASLTTLTVAVEQADMAHVPALANGQWRPVITSRPES